MPRQSHQRCSGDSTNQGSNSFPSDFDSPEFVCESPSTAEIELDAKVIQDPAEEASQWNRYAEVASQSTADMGTEQSASPTENRILANAIESSNGLLNQLVDQFSELSHLIASHPSPSSSGADPSNGDAEACEFRQQIAELKAQLAEVQQQNEELASQLARPNVRESVSNAESGSGGALSWEDRKAMILQQMEEDTFDSEAFIATLATDADKETLDPIAHVEQLHAELQQRDEEITELQCRLEKKSKTTEGDVTDTSAIAELVDADDLIREERDRLQKLRVEWEQRFRQGEIDASLERAKLSRERRHLARKNEELEEQLAHLRREAEEDRRAGVTGARRWLAKLGLDEKNRS